MEKFSQHIFSIKEYQKLYFDQCCIKHGWGRMHDGIHWQSYQVSQIRYENMRKVLKKSIFDYSVIKAATYQ